MSLRRHFDIDDADLRRHAPASTRNEALGHRVASLSAAVAMVCAALIGAPVTAVSEAAGNAVDCADKKVLCVDDSPGAMLEFSTIQAAVNKVKKGQTVVVAAGDYDGFRVSRRGNKNKRITIRALPGARVVSSEAKSDDGIYLRRASYVTIEGFEVDGGGAMRFGIATHDATANKPMRGVWILDNSVHDADSTNIYVSNTADSLVQGNVAYRSRNSHGIYLANAGSDNTVLRGNICYENGINGIHFNGDASVGGDGLHQDLLVENNILYANEANGFDADGVQDSVFRNNLVYGNGRHGLRVFAIDAAAGPANLLIVNNTFAGNVAWAVKLTQDSGGHTIFNNILLSGAGSLVVENENFRSDYNVVQNDFSLDGERTVLSFGQWKGLGAGVHSVKSKSNKVFQSARKSDYHLKKNSAALDAGTDKLAGSAAPDADIDSVGRPQGTRHDAGVYERQK